MRKSRVVGRGDEYLPDVSLAGLKVMHRRERLPASPKDMLQAAMLRKGDNALGDVCCTAGRPASATHGRLCRLRRERLGRRHSRARAGGGP